PRAGALLAAGVALPWLALALVVYAMIFSGGFFEKWGLNHALTLRHYVTAFGVDFAGHGTTLTGGAWRSVHTTLMIAPVSAPLPAPFGLLVAYLLARHRFAGKAAFEFV